MAGTPNPSADIRFGNGNLRTLPDLGEDVVLIVGASTGGPFNKPRRVSQMASILLFLCGPLVGQGSHHVTYSQPFYAQRCRYSTPGTFGSVTKTAAGSSPGTLSVGASSWTLRSQFVPNGAAMNVASGWVLPPYPQQLRITSGAGTVAHVQTVSYINEEGLPKTEAVSIAAAGDKLTTGLVKQIVRITSDVDPQGTQDYSVTADGPADRWDVQWRWVTGGQVSGGTSQPTGQWSGDNGRTWSRTLQLPSSGVVDLYTYAGGLVPQATGVRLTFASGTTGVTQFGSVRLPGGTVNGDLVFTATKLGVTVSIINPGALTASPSIAVVADAIAITSAHDGTNMTSTGAAIKAFLETDASAGAVAARARVRVRTVGTGLGIVGAAGATAFTNTHVTWTAKDEGVRVQVLESGISVPAPKVQVTLKDVLIYVATDANGIRTTTAAQLVTAVANDAKASLLLSGVASGTGAGLAGDTVGWLALVTAFDTGDVFSFSTTPPLPSSADLAEAMEELKKREDVLNNIAAVCLAKEGADDVDFTTLHTYVDKFGNDQKQFLFGLIGAPLQGATDENVWATAVKNAYVTRGTKLSVVAGDCDTILPAYGTEQRRNFLTLYVARLMICPISENPAHVECDTVKGIQYALQGVGSHLIPGGDPDRPEYRSLWQSEDVLVDLHSRNMVTPRTWPKLSGVFVRQGVQYTEDSDDWQFVTRRRIGNVAAALAYLETLRKINAEMLVDPQTGRLAEVEHQSIEANVRSFVGAKLLDDNGRRHVTALEVVSDRTIDFSRTFSVALALNIVTRSPAIRFTTTINVVRTLTQPNPGVPTA